MLYVVDEGVARDAESHDISGGSFVIMAVLGSFKGQYFIHMHAVDYSEAVYEIREASRAE
jgi:hypothetical protein